MNTIKHAITISRNYYDITEEEFMSKSRKREIVQCRQVAMYLLKKHSVYSLAKIGMACGGKNHATALHAKTTISNLIDTDKKIAKQIKSIEDMFLNSIDIENTDRFFKLFMSIRKMMEASMRNIRKREIRSLFKAHEPKLQIVNNNTEHVDEELKYILGIT